MSVLRPDIKRRILVLVGTDHHPFTRLCDWADSWSVDHPDDYVLVQHGYTDAPRVARSVEILTPAQLNEALADADVVVTHGGPGTISTVRSGGILPLVIPRDPSFGEHVDQHQMRFAAWAGERGLGTVVFDIDDLGAAVEKSVRADHAASDPGSQIATSILTLGDQITELLKGRRTRWSFPSLRRASRHD